jgi:hypothetical protein
LEGPFDEEDAGDDLSALLPRSRHYPSAPLPVTPALVGRPEGVLTQPEDLSPADARRSELAEALMEDANGANAEDPFVVLVLVDAKNGFNELSRKAALWTVRHPWPAGARLVFNCYKHSSTLVLHRHNRLCSFILHSREGVTQGDPLSMVVYGLTLVPLAKKLRGGRPRSGLLPQA